MNFPCIFRFVILFISKKWVTHGKKKVKDTALDFTVPTGGGGTFIRATGKYLRGKT